MKTTKRQRLRIHKTLIQTEVSLDTLLRHVFKIALHHPDLAEELGGDLDVSMTHITQAAHLIARCVRTIEKS